MNIEDTLSFVKKYALSDLNDLHFSVTEDMFHARVQKYLEHRLHREKTEDPFTFMKRVMGENDSLLGNKK